MKIAVKEDYKIFDLTDEKTIKVFLDIFQINNDEEIEIDVSGCLFDYHKAGFFLKLFEKIRNAGQPRKVTIYTTYKFLSDYTLYDHLFRESFISKNNSETGDTRDIKEQLSQKVKEDYNIDFKMEMRNV
jgi:hypothetical protein